MKCMMDTNGGKGYAEKPKGRAVAQCRHQMKVTTCDVESFVYGISKGFAWMPGVMKGGLCRENWQSQQLIALDFDNKDAAGAPLVEADCIKSNDVAARLLAHGIRPMCAYRTYSATREHPRFRVVIMLDEPCEDPDVMELAIDRLLYLFPEADQQCKDLARLFFGAASEKGVYDYTGSNWAPCDIRTILALPERSAETALDSDKNYMKISRRKPTYKNLDTRKTVDLDALKDGADLLGMIQTDTGEQGRVTGRRIEFHKCPICGHKDCFRYYSNNNSWTCFSDSNTTGRGGGSVIDYVMARDGVSAGAAIAALAAQFGGGEND